MDAQGLRKRPAGLIPKAITLLGLALSIDLPCVLAQKPPYAFTQPAAVLSATSATLNGMATPNGLASTAWFQWGTNNSYGNVTGPVPVGNGSAVVRVTNLLTGLKVGLSYYFRLVASNSAGTAYGAPSILPFGKRIELWGALAETNVPPTVRLATAIEQESCDSTAINLSGVVVAWGCDNQLGQTNVPPGLTNVVAISVGTYQRLALRADGSVASWGCPCSDPPPPLSNIVAVAAGTTSGLALRNDGTVAGWGDNYYGQLNFPLGLTNIVAVGGGYGYSVALKNDGTVMVWGKNDHGQTNIPPGLTNVVRISAAYGHILAIKPDGTVVAWGLNDYGQTNVPTGLSNVVAVSAGQAHSVALKADGTLASWGGEVLPWDAAGIAAVSAGAYATAALHDNSPPIALPQHVTGLANRDQIIYLSATDLDGDILSLIITSLPLNGALFQYTETGHGDMIQALQTAVSDPAGRVIFAPGTNDHAAPYASFQFLADDGLEVSAPGTVTIDINGGAPFVITHPAGPVTSNTAVLKGSLFVNSIATSAWFEWGSDTNYGSQTIPLTIAFDQGLLHITNLIAGLSVGESYHFRAVGSNVAGITYGADQMFATGKRVRAWGNNYFAQTTIPSGLTNAVAIAAGNSHTLALTSDGKVVGWGSNGAGQTNVPPAATNVIALAGGSAHSVALRGDGTVVSWGGSGQTGTVPPGISNIIAISAGGSDTFTLRADGTIAAWGFNGPETVPGSISNAVNLASGSDFAVALRMDGTVIAWGQSDYYNQLDVPPGLSNVTAVAAGYDHSVALKRDGTVVAWGANYAGQTNVPQGLANVVAVSAGGANSLALQADGTLVAWGQNTFGQTNVPADLSNTAALCSGSGYHAAIADNSPPFAFPGGVSGPANHDLPIKPSALDPNGDAISLKIVTLPISGSLYQLSGGGRGAPISSPGTLVSDPSGVVVFAPSADEAGNPYAGFQFVANDGTYDSAPATETIEIWRKAPYVFTHPAIYIQTNLATLTGMAAPNFLPTYCWFEWGTNSAYANQTTPLYLGDGGAIMWVTNQIPASISNRTYHYRLVATNTVGIAYGVDQIFSARNRIFEWGDNYYGQILVPSSIGNVAAVAGGYQHSLAIRNDGKVLAWGANYYGQTNVPAAATNVAAIAAGIDFSMAVTADGRLLTWGGAPTPPASLSNIVAAAGGYLHALALKADGTVAAWGDNQYGQTNIPAGLTNVVAVSAGEFHNVALRADGTVAALGGNTDGQTNMPTGLTNVIAVAAGDYGCLALKSDGTVVGWGSNTSGETNVPFTVTNIIAIASGAYHNLALQAGGRLFIWGLNSSGQANIPASLTNVTAIAGRCVDNSLLLGNTRPGVTSRTNACFPNHDTVITLPAFDADADPLSVRVISLPTSGALYQYALGTRGDPIVAANTTVGDPQNRLVFAPFTNSLGTPYAKFAFVADDGAAVSLNGTQTMNVVLPSAPQLSILKSGLYATGAFNINFTGQSNATYRVWASTNLANWDVLGVAVPTSNGWFNFLDLGVTNYSRRFYRAGAP